MAGVLQELGKRIVVLDGALGTRLQALTGNAHQCIDGFNLDPTFSEIVSLVHRSYVYAGSDIILTNTYGANTIKLGRHGRDKQMVAINMEGARLARKAAGDQAAVAGSIGPLEVYGARDEVPEEEMRRVFREQMAALAEGVDAFVLETFQDMTEAKAALMAAAEFGLPVLFSIGGVHAGRTGTGAEAQEMALMAANLGAVAVGANCRGPFDILETIRLLAQVTTLPLIAMANAGSPEIDRGRVTFHVEPQRFRHFTRELVEAGAAIIGGCCGTGPEHIKEIVQAAEELEPPPPRVVSDVRVTAQAPISLADGDESPVNQIDQVFASVPFIVSVEMRPVRSQAFAGYLESGVQLAAEGVHLFDVPDNAGAKVTLDPMVAAARLQACTRIPTIMHLSTSHRNLIATQSYLLGCWESGIQGVLAVTGDHPNVGDHDKYASRVNDVKSSVNLLKLIHGLNEGHLFNGTKCIRTNFSTGAGFNPMRNLTPQMKWLNKKLDAGARFVYTQPLYHEDDVDRLLEATAHLEVPILIGILPLTSKRNAQFFAAGKIPGIIIPQEILEAYEKITSPEDGLKLGIDLACDLLGKVQDKIRGCYIIPPFAPNKYEMVGELLRQTGLVRSTVRTGTEG